MKIWRFLPALAFVFGIFMISQQSFAQNAAANPDLDRANTPARTVRINLQQVEGSSRYEIVVRPMSRIWHGPMHFIVGSDNPVARLRLSPGDYTIQTRSIDKERIPGRWGPFKKFSVAFRALKASQPGEGSEIESHGGDSQTLVFEWPKVDQAPAYFFRLRDEEGKTLSAASTVKTFIRANVKPNRKYSWIVVPLKSKEQYKAVEANPNPGTYTNFRVLPLNAAAKGTQVKINPDREAEKYEIEVISISKEENTSISTIVETVDPNYRFMLPPGEYEMRARSVHDDKSVTAWSAPSKFFVKMPLAEIEGPAKNSEIESMGNDTEEVTLKWKKQKNVGSYKVWIYDSKGQLALTEQTKNDFLTVKLPENEHYKWLVKAYSAREIASDPDPNEANAAFSIDKYIPLGLSSAEEPSQYYSWARWVVSTEDYTAENWDRNLAVADKLLGGETELALGYWWRKTHFGVLVDPSIAGFLYQGKNYLYTSYGVHLGYRYLLDSGDSYRAWLGVSERETPEINRASDGSGDFQKVKSLGPQMEFAYLHPIDQKKGIQFVASTYLSQINAGTPNGLTQIPTMSYKMSIMGTYVWNEKIRVMAGYAYQMDRVEYQSTMSGQTNSTTISGHYLSLAAEYAIESKVK